MPKSHGKFDEKKLIELAIAAADRAHAPYSKFHVGAALALSDGTLVPGCNVENASYGLTNCAERTAMFAAVAMGRRDFVAMAIHVAIDDFVTPCGVCRQVLHELGPDMPILLVNKQHKVKRVTVKQLLPLAFGDDQLKAADH